MSIAAHLIDIAAFLDREVDTEEKRRDYGYWGHCTKVVKCTYKITFDDSGVIGIEALEAPAHAPVWAKGRSRNACPYPFCDNLKQFTQANYISAMNEACSRVIGMEGMPQAALAWCKNIDNFVKALDSFTALPKGVNKNNKLSQNIAFHYKDSAIALSEMPEVRNFIRANDYLFFNTWFDCFPDKKLDSAGRWYDVIDDRELKASEVCVSHIGFKMGNTGDMKLVSFNKELNDTVHSWVKSKTGGGGFNYPMSREHGRMMDAAVVWLMDYTVNKTVDGRETRSNPFTFSHAGGDAERHYLWFPVLNDSVGNIDSFIGNAGKMERLFNSLLSGQLPPGLETDGEGNAVSYYDVPPEWLTDDGILLFELVAEGRRATANRNPFSVEELIRNIDRYRRENESHGAAPGHYGDFKTALAIVLSGKPDFKAPNFKRLWEGYIQSHILGRRPVSMEITSALQQFMIYDKARLKASFRRAILVELAKAAKATPGELAESGSFALGKWCNRIAVAQKASDRPQTFRGDMMRSVYFGKVDVGAEISAYTTLTPENAREMKERREKGIEERKMKYFVPKTRFASTLHNLALLHEKEGEGAGYPIDAIFGDRKRFAARPVVRTSKDRSAFIIGYMSGLCKELFTGEETESV